MEAESEEKRLEAKREEKRSGRKAKRNGKKNTVKRKLNDFCLLLDPAEGYARAKETLKNNLGRKNVTAHAYIEKMQKGSLIKVDDS